MEFTYPVIPNKLIRPNSNNKDVRRCNSPCQSGRKISSRHSPTKARNVSCFSEKLIPLRISFQEMSTQLHQFSSECSIDVISPSLMSQYKILEKEYEIFCSQANVILNSIHPSTSLQNSIVTSANIRQANLVMKEWVELIKHFNLVTCDGLMPHFNVISKEFGSLKVNVKNIIKLFSNGNLMPSIHPSLVQKIYSQIDEYKKMYFELYRKVEFHKDFDYNVDEIFPNVEKLIQSIGSIFLYELPNITMSTRDIMMKKNQVTFQCNYLLKLISGTAKFTQLGNESIDSFKKLNNQFKSLFDFLKIPFSIELNFNDDESPEIQEEEEDVEIPSTPDESTLKNQKVVDSMKKKIDGIQSTIQEAQSKE